MNSRLEEHFLTLIDPFYLDATLDNCPDLPRALIDFGRRFSVFKRGTESSYFC